VELVELHLGARDVEVLAADHPERRPASSAPSSGGRTRARAERLREQRVAGEERDALAEGDVRARPPAALVVVVERGQVVVDERERVDELERHRRGQRVLGSPAGGLRRREAEDGADPLASAGERVAHRLGEAVERRRRREIGRAPARRARGARQAPASAAWRARCTSASISFASSAISASPSTAASTVAARIGTRLERVDSRLQALQQLLRTLQRGVRAAAHRPSLAILPRIPLTSRAASSLA
jgi:hypothetical protein